MLATSTHDTKRSEDVRAAPPPPLRDPRTLGRGGAALGGANERHRRGGWPDRNTEYLLYQTLVGAWPHRGRARSHLHGEGRPRSQSPYLLDAHERDYEEAVRGFVTDCAGRPGFAADLEPLWRRSSSPGA